MSEVKDKERLLKAAREKQLIMYKEAPIRLLADFSVGKNEGHKGMAQYIQSAEKKHRKLPRLLDPTD